MPEKGVDSDDPVMIPYNVGEWLDRVGALEVGQNQIVCRLDKLEEGQCRIEKNVKAIKDHLLKGESGSGKGSTHPTTMAAQSQD